MIIPYDELFENLICEDVELTENDESRIDPWDGEKPYASDGFVVNYCMDYSN